MHLLKTKHWLMILFTGLLFIVNSCAKMNIEWTVLPPLPPLSEGGIQPGVAGPFAGIHAGTLIVAGGANFTDTMPWYGGRKRYHSEIYSLRLSGNADTWKINTGGTALSSSVAYGASASVDAGVVCVGGETEHGLTGDAFIISMAGGRLIITPLPPLPVPLSNSAAAAAGSTVYIAGGISPDGSSNALWSINTDEVSGGWKKLADLPLPLINSVMVAFDAKNPSLWVFGGRTRGENDDFSAIRSEVFKYSIADDKWSHEGDMEVGSGNVKLAAGTGASIGKRYAVLFGGNDGTVFNSVEKILSQIAREADTEKITELRKQYVNLQETHPGFSREIIIFDTEKGKCSKAGEIPGQSQVTTLAVKTSSGVIIPSGEIRPGVRTPVIRLAKFK